MLKKDFNLCDLIAKVKLRNFDFNDNIIMKLNEQNENKKLHEALKIKRMNEIIDNIKTNLPKNKINLMENSKNRSFEIYSFHRCKMPS